MAYYISSTLRVPLAEREMVVTGSSLRLVKDIREALGQLSGSRAYAPGNLGVAFSVGKHQHTPLARAIRKKRFRIFRA
eukprot:3196071-Pyramimonas_sp.AAC.1